MSQQLKIRDHENARPVGPAWLLDWSEGVPVTLRTLIAERVRQEYENRAGRFDARTLRLVAPPSGKSVDVEELIAQAIRGFERGAFVVLADDRQCTDLDAELRLTAASVISFIRLVPLRAG